MPGVISVRVIDLKDLSVVSAAGKTLRTPRHAIATAQDYKAVFSADHFIIRIHHQNLSDYERSELRRLADIAGVLVVDGWT